ncbi:hypothetical protein RHGRI_011828 [Rhododendron griersonianum]|uniref:Uncharacterized protein n=1 Tax=Rhododendron griersonianum TaxID=479676 RepID=A0AAV6KNA3_9ERIC|nr:hypothetical protein RHGRI_011828 [Rhododendron griersonianum]
MVALITDLPRLGLQLDREEQVFDQAPSTVMETLRNDRDGLGVHRVTASSIFIS